MKLSPPFVLKRGAFSLGIVVLLIWLFLYTQADLIYGQYADLVRQEFTVYFFLFLITATVLFRGMPGRKEGAQSLIPFVIAFVVTLAVAIPMRQFAMQASLEYVTLILGFGLLHGFVKAFIEEIVFRYYLPMVAGLGDILSSVIFGLFHTTVALMSGVATPITAIIGLMVMGYVWSLVRRLFQNQGIGAGIAASTGSHFGYNIVVLGLI
jgi:hypothetical protein